MITASYRGQEFVRVGYYVSIDYAEAELKENPPPNPIFEKVITISSRLRALISEIGSVTLQIS